ncbi:hypothetical protein SAICODRAFT_18736 [Saitoella complicata NRRL Y-17804]|nr:uncharacterized protein SAICODRAFT_18736 [Saitoella complicata NRRL Y-17804]ODQ53706.1 hypothetical protein SAICODRAFT_18736 [Saitoella complicata NRRL Y-17804]
MHPTPSVPSSPSLAATPSSPSIMPGPVPRRLSATSVRRASSSSLRGGVDALPPPMPRQASNLAELHEIMSQESEAVTNALLKRLDDLRRDKIRIEAELEAESESIVNRLSRQIAALRAQHASTDPNTAVSDVPLASPVASSGRTSRASSFVSERTPSRAGSLRREPSVQGTPHRPAEVSIVDSLKAENEDLRRRLREAEDKIREFTKTNARS